MRIIDIHAHVLPGVDDGSRSMAESMRLLAAANVQGIQKVIATPHYSRKRGSEGYEELVEQLRARIKKSRLDVELYLGQETFYHDGLAEALLAGKALTLAGSQYVLVEFQPTVPYQVLYQGLRKITQAGFTPVVAHVERYACLRKPDHFREIASCKYCLQMNYDSLAGHFWNSSVRWCRERIKRGEIHMLATDMHRKDWRRPDLEKPMKWLEKNVDSKLLADLTYNNPLAVINNERIR